MRRRLAFGIGIASVTLSALLPLTGPGTAWAHVHGITPLLGCSVDNPNSGANGTNDTPAAAANGGPIQGIIPRDVGNAPLSFGDGGFGATAGHCP